MATKSKKTTEQFINDSIRVHGAGKYDYASTVYTHSNKPVSMRCIKHDYEFTVARASFHTSKAQGCPVCAGYRRLIPANIPVPSKSPGIPVLFNSKTSSSGNLSKRAWHGYVFAGLTDTAEECMYYEYYARAEQSINELLRSKTAGTGGMYRNLLRNIPAWQLAFLARTVLVSAAETGQCLTAADIAYTLGQNVRLASSTALLDALIPDYMTYENLQLHDIMRTGWLKQYEQSVEHILKGQCKSNWPRKQCIAIGGLLLAAVADLGYFKWEYSGYGGYNILKAGYLYLLESEDTPGLCKVGITNKLQGRMDKLKRETPFTFAVKHSVKLSNGAAVFELEKQIHSAYASYRAFNLSEGDLVWDGFTEWFTLNAGQVQDVITRMNSVAAAERI